MTEATQLLREAVRTNTVQDAISYFAAEPEGRFYRMGSNTSCAVAQFFEAKVGAEVLCSLSGINVRYDIEPGFDVSFQRNHWAAILQDKGIDLESERRGSGLSREDVLKILEDIKNGKYDPTESK